MAGPDAPRYVVAEKDHLDRIEQIVTETIAECLGGVPPGWAPRVRAVLVNAVLAAAAAWLLLHL